MIRFLLWFSTWMAALCFALFLMFCPSGSRAEVPGCFPGEPASSFDKPAVIYDADNCAAVWFCDEGTGAWVRRWLSGSGDECKTAYATAMAVMQLTHDQKVALWKATFTGQVTPAESAALPENILAQSVQVPSITPPSGLTVKEVRVYKLVTSINAPMKFSLVGTTKLGTPCDTSLKVGALYRIDRNLVTFAKGAIMPPSTFAKCD